MHQPNPDEILLLNVLSGKPMELVTAKTISPEYNPRGQLKKLYMLLGPTQPIDRVHPSRRQGTLRGRGVLNSESNNRKVCEGCTVHDHLESPPKEENTPGGDP